MRYEIMEPVSGNGFCSLFSCCFTSQEETKPLLNENKNGLQGKGTSQSTASVGSSPGKPQTVSGTYNKGGNNYNDRE